MAARDRFRFPFEPWSIQTQLMEALYTCIDEHKIGVFESPTGTGKSLSLICGALAWLKDNEYKIDEDALRSSLLSATSTEPEWVRKHSINAAVERERCAVQDAQRAREAYNKMLLALPDVDHLSSLIKKRRRNHDPSDEESAREKRLRITRKLHADSLINDIGIDVDSFDSLDVTEGDPGKSLNDNGRVRPRVYICSRTHSQLSQFAKEIRRTGFSGTVHATSLGSRKLTCLNPSVKRLSSVSYMNEACKELIKSDSKKGCEYYHGFKDVGDLFAKYVHRKVQDIEEIVSIGAEMHCCPYFGVRGTIEEADVVMLPYNLVFQKSSREALGIDLKGSIVIVDEAHNIIDAITSMHSVDIYSADLDSSYEELTNYINKFETRFNPANLVRLKSLKSIISLLIECLKGSDVDVKSSKDAPDIEASQIISCSDFLHLAKLDVFNMYEIVEFIAENKIPFKITSYRTSKQREAGRNDNVSDDTNIKRAAIGRPSLQLVSDFLATLTNQDSDGRVVVDRGDMKKLRYTLLHPGQVFGEVAQQARSVILAGGTMKPSDDILYQLLDEETTKRLTMFSCGHVVDKENVRLLTLTKGPAGEVFDFRFSNRRNVAMIKDLGMTLSNIAQVVPAGMIVFVTSFDYLDYVVEVLKREGIWARLAMKKPTFVEPRDGGSLDKVLSGFCTAVDRDPTRGALLFAVIGGKLSEGINFSNDYGRVVVVVGMPYPNAMVPEFREKLAYVRKRRGGAAGVEQAHCETLCMKAVNQTVGRAVRHRDDYAAVILVDMRYTQPRIMAQLPVWLRAGALPEGSTTFANTQRALGTFFRARRSAT